MSNYEVTSSTYSVYPDKYDDTIVQDFIDHVRNAPLESDAVHNIPVILRRYDRLKTMKQRLLSLFL